MMTFLKNIKNSIYGPAYYRELLARPLSGSLKYYFSLALVLAVIFTVKFSLAAVPASNAFMKSLGPTILKCYPPDLEVTLDKGKVFTNVTEPCIIKMPEEWRGKPSQDAPAAVDNILVIDTANDFNLERFNAYKTLAWLNKDSFAMRDDNKVSVTSLAKAGNWKFSRPMLSGIVDIITPYLILVSPVVVIGIFAGLFLAISAKLLYLFFLALLVWLAAKIKKLSIGYANAYKVGIHLLTLGLFVEWILVAFKIPGLRFPFWFTIVTVILALVNLRRLPAAPVSTETIAAPQPPQA